MRHHKDQKQGSFILTMWYVNISYYINCQHRNNLKRAKGEANTKYLSKTYVVIQRPNSGEVLVSKIQKGIEEEIFFREYLPNLKSDILNRKYDKAKGNIEFEIQ